MSEQEKQENQGNQAANAAFAKKERNARGATLDSVHQDNEDALGHPSAHNIIGEESGGEKTPTYAPTSSPPPLDTENPPAGIHIPHSLGVGYKPSPTDAKKAKPDHDEEPVDPLSPKLSTQ